MLKPPTAHETKLAQDHKSRLLSEFRRRRTNSLLLAAVFGVLIVVALAFEQPMLAFNAAMVLLIFVIRAVDTHGVIQDVRRRPGNALVVRTAFGERDPAGKTATDPGVSR